MIIKERGITGEVFTLYSGLNVGQVVNSIVEKKCQATINWIKSLEVEVKRSTIIGTYLTGMKLSEMLSEFSKITVIDIHPHLRGLVNCEAEFYDDLTNLEGADLVVDTTGLGGISPEAVQEFVDANIFLIEDPTSDGSDKAINSKNNINKRLKAANSQYKGLLQTGGLKTKTSGTMTLTMEVLRCGLDDVIKREGVLYGVAAMNFYEGVLFKEKDCDKFLKLLNQPALVISSLQPVSPDKYLKKHVDEIKCTVEHAGL